MIVVITIDGRDALPVWTIPYVTSRIISPDMLIKKLVDPKYAIPSFPSAFNLNDNKPSLIPPEWWSETEFQIALLDEELGFTAKDRFDWCNRSIGIIMQNNRNCYLWLDEFKKWFDRRTINCVQVKLCLNPPLSTEHELYFKETEKISNQTTLHDGAEAIKSHVAGREPEAETFREPSSENIQELSMTPRAGGYAKRDIFAIGLVENRPELLKMRRGEIKVELQKVSDLFKDGRFDDWWRTQRIFPKSMGGRS